MPFYDDDGNEINTAELPVAQMCLMCEQHDPQNEDILCTLNRIDQLGEPVFSCGAFVSLYGPLLDDILD